jgi:cell division septation protein DedD
MNMNKTSEGEQELVLGNKQLLGIFFVVVALLGVFFSLGYIIGRNTANASNSLAGATPPATSGHVDQPAERAPEQTATVDPPPTGVPETTHAAQPAPTPAAVAESPAPPKASAKPRAVPVERQSSAVLKTIPSGEHYLQVSAIHRTDAENEVKVLRERGFPALLGESSKENLFRVLVGPFPDVASLHLSKEELKRAGFESIVAK